MLYPHAGHYSGKWGPWEHIPAIAGYYMPCPVNAAGSPVWVRGRTMSAIGIITAVSPDGKQITVVGAPGWEAKVPYDQVLFLGPTPYRSWVLAHTLGMLGPCAV